MVKFTIEQIQSIMKSPDCIRNISIIAHVDHGKTTLSDSLVARAGIIADKISGDAKYLSTSQIEQDRGITIKSSSISLHFSLPDQEFLYLLQQAPKYSTDNNNNASGSDTAELKSEFLINMIDSPGHIDFSPEVTAALRVTDGAVVVVDCVEGCGIQTETVLRQALSEAIKPVLFINKIDRFIRELVLEGEEMYTSFRRVIDHVNGIIGNYITYDTETGVPTSIVQELSPITGNVTFGSGYVGFGFGLRTFAKMYSLKFGVSQEKLVSKFWGDNFYCPERKKFVESNISPSGMPLKRAFVQFIADPITSISTAVLEGNTERLTHLMKSLGIVLDPQDKELEGRLLFRAVMRKWLPVADTILEMVVAHLPSPVVAQKYRVSYLYEGPQDDEVANAIRNCDPNGPMVMFVSKMIPTSEKGHFYAFGRVFAGTVRSSQKVRILNSGYGKEVYEKSIQRPVLLMGRKTENIDECPCGNLTGVIGVDQFIVKSATITTSSTIYPIKSMKFTVSPVVRTAISPRDPRDLPKLIEGMKRLSKADPSVLCTFEETGELIIAGVGELHLDICINSLQTEYANVGVVVSEPVVNFRESILNASTQVSVSKSPNNMNRFYATAEPLSQELARDLEDDKLPPLSETKSVAKYLHEKHSWDLEEGKNIWSFGPFDNGPNMLCNQTKGIQYMNEIKDSVVQTFQWVSREGILCEENLYGVKFNILDAKLHADAIHRGDGQIVPAVRRVLYASQLTANPILLEPIYSVEIVTSDDTRSGVYSVLSKRRGSVVSEEMKLGMPLLSIRAHLPVLESFGFIADLRSHTSGRGFAQCLFSHWSNLGTLEEKKVFDIVTQTRQRKGLNPEIPPLSKFHDNII